MNIRSGSQNRTRAARRLKAIIEASNLDCDLLVVRGGTRVVEEATRAVRSAYRTIIAAGGDGTINAVASQVIGTDKRLGVLPLGTFNYFARELRVPMNVEKALLACLDGRTANITVGEVNGRIFLNNASIGLYPAILCMREQTYKKWGRRSRLIAYLSLLRTIVRLRLNMTLTIMANGGARTFETPMVFVARNAYQLDEFGVPGGQAVEEGAFSVFVVPPAGKLRLLNMAWHTFMRKLEPETDFELINTSELTIESPRILRAVAFDGERVKMLAPLHFRVREHALKVAVPHREDQEVAA